MFWKENNSVNEIKCITIVQTIYLFLLGNKSIRNEDRTTCLFFKDRACWLVGLMFVLLV
jgi:hypothetical protein